MSDAIIPAEVQQFLRHSVDSIAQLEALLLLRDQPDRHWTSGEIAEHLYVSVEEVVAIVLPLVERRLVFHDKAGFTYQPENAELDGLVEQVAELYRRYLIPVTHFIHSKPPRSAMQAFANAFRIRKD